MSIQSKFFGFTLIELTVVLFIISLLLGGLLVPLASQLEGRQRAEAKAQMDGIVEALIGFAIINGRLPCYTIQTDPTAADYGEEASPCNALAQDGYLPWKTLGLTEIDPWGVPRTAAASAWTGYWRYRVDDIFRVPFNLTAVPGNALAVDKLDLLASVPGTPAFNSLTSVAQRPVAIIYSTGANQTADGKNFIYDATYEGDEISNMDRDGDGDEDKFDDLVIWLSRPLLFNKMVNAGILP
jgi:prepilin-type N-terminal cleavage/methylation domain-containing protein